MQIVKDLMLYLIKPPWHDDLLKKFPTGIQETAADYPASIGLGHHHEYGFFALKLGQPLSILWLELDPERKITAPADTLEPKPRQRAPEWFCPCCGSELRVVAPDDEEWGEFCDGYRAAHRTEWFLCSGERTIALPGGSDTVITVECVFQKVPLVLHNPVNGWNRPAGDNWALGYVK